MKDNEEWSDGPWFADVPMLTVDGQGGEVVAELLGSVTVEPCIPLSTAEANARLISVAPELVEGIEALREWMAMMSEGFNGNAYDNGYDRGLDRLDAILQPLLDRARGVDQ